MYNVVILPLAKQDIEETAKWYSNKQKGLGKTFINQIKNKVLIIREFPHAFAIRYDEMRTVTLDSFPYMIHFSVNPEEQKITIAAVFHTSIDPDKWEDRL